MKGPKSTALVDLRSATPIAQNGLLDRHPNQDLTRVDPCSLLVNRMRIQLMLAFLKSRRETHRKGVIGKENELKLKLDPCAAPLHHLCSLYLWSGSNIH